MTHPTLRSLQSHRSDAATATHAVFRPGVRLASRGSRRGRVALIALLAALWMAISSGAARAADDAGWVLGEGPQTALGLRLDPAAPASPGPNRFSLAGDLPGEVGPAQGWTLLAGPDKMLAGQDLDRPVLSGPDWPGIGRDTAFFFAYQAISVAILYVLPGDINRWSNDEVSLGQWWDNVRNPTWDSDPWATNYISHPYWGATYYIRARERGFGKLASFGYSAFLSTLYEYGAEAFFEPPSGQDLMVTPIVGSLLGAFVFEPIRDWVKVKPELRWYDHAVLIATDPFGALNSVFEVMLGIKSEILFRPVPPTLDRGPAAGGLRGRRGDGSRPTGASVHLKIVWE